MKKRLLFVIPSLRSGGAEKSLVTLLQLLDSTRFDVDLLLFRRDGLFLSQVPQWVRVLDAGADYAAFDSPISVSVRYFLRRGKFLQAVRRLCYGRLMRSGRADVPQRSWKYIGRFLPRLRGYDAAIAYLEGTSTYYVVDRVQAGRKLAFLHTDYERLLPRRDMDAPYYEKIDCLIGVSQACTARAEAAFPFLRGKTATMHNLIAPTVLRAMAGADTPFPRDGVPNLLTVGRLSAPKGIDIAVRACGELKRRGVCLRWYHLGVGEMRGEIETLIDAEDVRGCFFLLGERENPYPYFRQCDVYVQPSRFEGKSIAVDEAKCFARPIVVTDFGTVRDQIGDGVTGIVAEKTPQSVADAVERLLRSPELCRTLSDNLGREQLGNAEEIETLYALL